MARDGRKPAVGGTVVIGLLLIPVTVNVATAALPERWVHYSLWAVPVAVALTVLAVILERRSNQASSLWSDRFQPPGDPDRTWNIPRPSGIFYARHDILTWLSSTFTDDADSPVVALYGAPGIGKSQLALSHGHAVADRVRIGWHIRATTRVTAIADLATLAERLGVGQQDQKDAAEAVVRRLGELEDEPWLLIFDDAPDLSVVESLIPQRGGQIVITSRNPHWESLAGPYCKKIDPFPLETAATFLKERSGDNGERASVAATELARELGGLPMALDQAGAHCRQTGQSLTHYLSRYRVEGARLLAEGPAANFGSTPVGRALSLSLRGVARRNLASVQLLFLFSYIAPNGIPRDFPVAAPSTLPRRLRRAVKTPGQLDAAISTLVEASLIEYDQPGQLRIHQLTQAVLRDSSPLQPTWLWRALQFLRVPGIGVFQETKRKDLLRAAISQMIALDPKDPLPPDLWSTYAVLLPHIEVVNGHLGDHPIEPVGYVQLLDHACRYLWRVGQAAESVKLGEATFRRFERLYGQDDSRTLSAANTLAGALWARGDLKGSRRLVEKTRGRYQHLFGEEHEKTLGSTGNLALLLREMGEYQSALELDETALSGQRRLLGMDDPYTLNVANNMTNTLRELGRYGDACELSIDTLERRRRTLGVDHPDTLDAANNLALAFQALGRHDEARDLIEDTLNRRRQVLGEDHSDTLESANNLASLLRVTGDIAGALELHQGIHKRRSVLLGEEHPETLRSAAALAVDLKILGRDVEQRSLIQEILARHIRILGDGHPETLQLARLLRDGEER